MRIIIVEQDAALGVFLTKGLMMQGHDVKWTDGAEEALALAQAGAPNLMVIDVSSDSGTGLLATIHQRHRRTAVLTLTGCDSVQDRVRCLDLGADDCMTKPFSFHELAARCRAIFRRQERSGEIVMMHGELRLERISRSVSMADWPISLTAKEFRLLEYLLQNAGRCCSRSELMAQVFDLAPENGTNVVDVYINYLRKKLSVKGDFSGIRTVRGAGYRLDREGFAESGPGAAAVPEVCAHA